MEQRENRQEEVLVKPGKKKNRLPVILLSIVLLAAAAAGFLYADDFRLAVEPRGEMEMLVPSGREFEDPGADVVLYDRWLFPYGLILTEVPVEMHSDMNSKVLGKYSVSYSAQIFGLSATAERSLRVVDTVSPVLTLISSGKTILPGRPYEEEGYIAVDNFDGNLTDQVKRTVGLDTITYTVMDSSGNPTTAERKIPYFDPLPPDLVLEGEETIAIPCGTVYADPGYTATDNADGDMTEAVAVEGQVLWYQPGTYELVYTVADAFGNVTQKVRTVTVEAQSRPEVNWPKGKVIYLTFDDGPGPYTGWLLDILRKYGVKATFFVTDSGYDAMMARIVKEGHSIGIHTMTHDYDTIYASEEAFFNDLAGMQDIIYRNTGVKTTLMRFPGGGSNVVSRYNEGIMTRLSQAVQDAGFQYFDWNVDSNDAGGALRAKTVAANVIGGADTHRVSVVLQHDIHAYSVEAVEDIIVWGLNNGYKFLPLKSDSPTMHHTVLN